MSDFVMGATIKLNNEFSGKMSAIATDTENFKAMASSADQAMGNLDKSINKLDSKGISDLSTAANQAATATDSVVAPINNIVTSTNRAQNAIQSFNRGWQSVKELPSTLRNVGSTLKNNVVNGFTSARLQASVFAATVKTVGKQKLTGIVNSLKQFKTTITEGKTGVAGFGTALKNIGKISIANTVNGIKTLASKAKDFAKTNLSGITSKFKNLTSSFKSGASGTNTLFTALKKVAGVSLNALHSSISKVGNLAKSAGSAVANGLGKSLKVAVKGAGVAAAAGATAVGAIVTKSVTAFADYEQLVGGVETLFKDSAGIVETYADNAFKTAGLSANDYMETVTGFSASLLQSIGGDTEKAARFADVAISDMADNANKMGTSMESIQNAYQGFAKQNYTMLDNLKLGYGGTKEEMQRLLTDAGKLAGQKFDLSSYADIVQAIHVVQNEMGITGTTALEAEHTIQGSAASMKAAWGNMLVSLTKGGEGFDVAVDNLVNTVKTFGNNIMPAIVKSLTGVGKLIADLAPMIAKEIPTLIGSVLPPLLSATTAIVDSLATALPGLITTITPSLVQGVIQVFTSLASALPQILLVGLDLIIGLAQGITQGLPQILQVAVQSISTFIMGLANRIPDIMNTATQLLLALAQGITQNLPTLLQTGMQAVLSLVQGIVNNLPALLQAAVTAIMAFVQGWMSNLGQMYQTAAQVITTLVNGLVSMLPMIIQSAIQLIISLVQGLIQNLPMIIQSAVQIVVALAGGLIQAIPQLIAAIPQLTSAIVDTLLNTNWLQVGWDIVKGIGKGLWDGVKGIFGGGGEEGGAAVANGAAAGITANMGTVTSATSQVSTNLTAGLQPDMMAINTSGANTMSAMADGITTNAGLVYDSAAAIAPGIGTSLNTGLATVDTVSTATTIGTGITDGVTTGIQTGTDGVVTAASGMATQAQGAIDAGMANMSTSLNGFDISGFEASCDGLINAITEGITICEQTIDTGVQNMKTTIDGLNLYNSGVDIMTGLNNGMLSMKSSIIATAQSIADSVKTTINSALDIHSPSRVLEESGEYTGLGFANGLLSLINRVKDNAQSLAEAAVTPFSVKATQGDISASGNTVKSAGRNLGGLRVMVENLVLQNVGDKDPKQLVKEILAELYAQLGGDDELLSDVDMGVLL